MNKILILVLAITLLTPPKVVFSQTTLDTAVNFHVKTIDGLPVWLFKKLDEENKIVVIDFFSTSCGPCQTYAPDFQGSYEDFGKNSSNVYYMGINRDADNDEVRAFDSTYNLTYPTVSGLQGGGNKVFIDYNILSYPTVIVITPEDHLIVNKEIDPPVRDSINKAVIAAGGIMVGIDELNNDKEITIYPNPVHKVANIKLNQKPKTDILISVFDILGRIKTASRFHPGFSNNYPLNLQNLNSGIYFLRIEYNNIVITRQIFKTN